jgi:predicted ABC-type ATPase
MNSNKQPQFVVMAGPNGAGKSTAAGFLLAPSLPFLNADEIAKQLKADGNAGNADLEAGRLLLRRMDELTAQNADFAVETTLASRAFAPRVVRLRRAGYQFILHFMWLPAPEMSIARVAERVRKGGHDIPEEVIRRRYEAGLTNFFQLYEPLADVWRFYDNSRMGLPPKIMASGVIRKRTATQWFEIRRQYGGT